MSFSGRGRPRLVPISLPLRLSPFLWLPAAALLAGCQSKPSPPICPSIAIQPHFAVLFSPSLRQEGATDVELEIDGQREVCTISASGIGPAKDRGAVVEGPTTRTETSCQGLTVSGISTDGGIGKLSIPGTKASIKVKLMRGGKVLGEGSFKPDYRPDACGFVQPSATVKLAL